MFMHYIAILISVLLFLNCSNSDNPTAPTSLPIDSIVFVSERDGHSQIYKMNLDGSNQINLSKNNIDEFAPLILPNSNRIVFGTIIENDTEIWSMNLNGGNKKNLTNYNGRDQGHVCSPTGSKIAFNRDLVDIFIMNSDGSEVINLTDNPTSFDSRPRFSPHGSTIVFYSDRNFRLNIFTMDIWGGNLTNLTGNGVEWGQNPIFSPDGKMIAYSDLDLWIMDSDGKNKKRLIETEYATEDIPHFLPDSKHILYYYWESGMGRNSEIYKINIENNQVTNLTKDNSSENFLCDISKDGSTILFQTNRDGNWQIYSMDVHGNNVKNLSKNSSDEWSAKFL
jgi:Tol biopolymer transport system component